MKVTYSWLKDFVKIKLSPQALAGKLTMAGLEVVSLEEKNKDFILEIEITSNRPDWLSIIGVAREVAVITGERLQIPKPPISRISGKENYSIGIEDALDCPVYTAKIIRGVKVGPSPQWLKERLELVGLRSVNNVVDITNYVLFEWGEPLHAFDLDTLEPGAIIVRRAKKGEKMVTIDGLARELDPDILVIADKNKPVAVAGVMGGKDTEVGWATKNILLEAAAFNPVVVRCSRQKLGVQSEAAYRFERSVDPGVIDKASWRAAELIKELALGACVLAKSSAKIKISSKPVSLDVSRARAVLGADIKSGEMKRILSGLAFTVKKTGKERLIVTAPSHRQDVSSDIDLIEEIARIYGYENIPNSIAKPSPKPAAGENEVLVSLVKETLIGQGLNEVITYSLLDKELLKKSGCDAETLEVMNPLSSEQGVLRPTVTPSLVRCIAYNLNQRQEPVNIFEIARAFFGPDNHPREEPVLGVALCGVKSLLLESGAARYEQGMRQLKGVLEVLLERLGIVNYSYAQTQPGKFDVLVSGQKIGTAQMVEKGQLDYLDIKNKKIAVAELKLDKLFSFADIRRKFRPIPRYPAITRDISFVLRDDIGYNSVLSALREAGKPLLKEAQVIDYYKGEQIPAGFKGLTIACCYRSEEKTLTEDQISPVHALLCETLKGKFQAKIR